MIDNLLHPAVLCFAVGILAGVLRSDLRFPDGLYETLSIYLLLAIGLKGGVQISDTHLASLIFPTINTIILAVMIPLIAFPILHYAGRFSKIDSAAIASHYGSVSAVTFAIVLTYLDRMGVFYEEYVTALLVVMEIPAIIVGIAIARLASSKETIDWTSFTHEIFLGKSIFLLLAGLVVGYLAGKENIAPAEPLFFNLFSGVLMFFLLEMGMVTSKRLSDLKRVGAFLFCFAIFMPLFSGFIGVIGGMLAGLSVGGTTVLAVLSASSSYIAAPAAMRIAVPKANPTYYLTASLGVTFPFNILLGIPIYYWMAKTLMGGS